jgi:hypothetical protein
MSKLWTKSWDTIGAFFKDMKAIVLPNGGDSVPQVKVPGNDHV